MFSWKSGRIPGCGTPLRLAPRKNNRRFVLEQKPAPRRARPPKDGLAFGRDKYSCHAPGGCYIFSLTPLTRAITSPHAGQRMQPKAVY
jgi:hypothetical protein